MLKYTICFIKYGDEILMLNREKSPNMGLWNGVGGKIEEGETHLQSVIREAYEETGIQLKNPTFAGEVVWLSNSGNVGLGEIEKKNEFHGLEVSLFLLTRIFKGLL